MAFPKFKKDPQAVLDYKFDWVLWLDGDTIATSTSTAEDGLTIAFEDSTNTDATVWLSGGVEGDDYNVTNEITTDGGRTDDRTITIQVRQK